MSEDRNDAGAAISLAVLVAIGALFVILLAVLVGTAIYLVLR